MQVRFRRYIWLTQLYFVQAFVLKYRNPWKVFTDRRQRATQVRKSLESQSQMKANYTIKTVVEVSSHQRTVLWPEAISDS